MADKEVFNQEVKAEGDSKIQNVTQVINIIKGNLKPILLLLIPVLVGVAVLLVISLKPHALNKCSFNIAVAALLENKDGKMVKTGKGKDFANLLANNLQLLLDPGALPTKYCVWGPKDRVLWISGSNPEERVASAAKVGQDLGAHVVIYGSYDLENNSLVIEPKFYIGPQSFVLGAELTGSELTGEYDLGMPITIPLPTENALNEPRINDLIIEKISPRAEVLANFASGLSAYAFEDYGKAKAYFLKADEIATRDWQGRESVIDLFLGAVELNTGIQTLAQPDFNAAQLHFDAAHDWFTKTASTTGDGSPPIGVDESARSAVGHGFTDMQEVNLLIKKENLAVPLKDPQARELLEHAIRAFEDALGASYKPPRADVIAKANYGLGWAYFLKSEDDQEDIVPQADEADFQAQAAQSFHRVIDEFKAGNTRLQELAARSYGWLGLLNYHLGKNEEAYGMYECAVQYGQYKELIQKWQEIINKICSGNDCQVFVKGDCGEKHK